MVAKEERDKLGELYGELFTDIVLQLGRVYILSLLSTSKNLSILNLLGFTICAHEVNCRNNSSTKEVYSLYPLNTLNNNSRSANYIATYKVQSSK